MIMIIICEFTLKRFQTLISLSQDDKDSTLYNFVQFVNITITILYYNKMMYVIHGRKLYTFVQFASINFATLQNYLGIRYIFKYKVPIAA